MITTRIIGGLGNQLFQYACGRALSEHHGVPLRLDLQGFQKYKLHQYQLDKFAIIAPAATAADVPKIFRFGPWSYTYLPTSIRQKKYITVREQSLAFDPTLASQGPNLYLDGYWQSERYFLDIQDILHQEFQLGEPLDPENQYLTEEMQKCASVSLHVRRTDYVNNPTYAQCTVDYYHRALDYISVREKELKIFVFSDDMAWVKSNLRIDFPTTYVTNNYGRANYLDVVLMHYCLHSIIANSSFSWWGAWLKKQVNGLVIAPNTWYTDPRKVTRDLLPTRWVTIPN